jgi:hypothetical protein
MRGRRPRKRMDLSDLRALTADRRIWCSVGKVIVPDDHADASHYTLVTGAGGAVTDLLVEVELQPSLQDVTCRMSGFAGGAGRGIWTVPAVGDEVLVALPEGQIAFMPTIIAILATRDIPHGGSQGPAAGRTIIVNSEVLVHDGSGGAVPLALKSDVDQLADYVDNTLAIPVVGGGGGTAGPGATSAAPAAAGTDIFKAK